MAYLFPPLCLAYIAYLLFFTIAGSPKIHLNVYKTLNDLFRANLAEVVLRAVIPFLLSLVLIVVGLRQSLWNRALDSKSSEYFLNNCLTKYTFRWIHEDA